jgi:hypothetical protein
MSIFLTFHETNNINITSSSSTSTTSTRGAVAPATAIAATATAATATAATATWQQQQLCTEEYDGTIKNRDCNRNRKAFLRSNIRRKKVF